MLKCKFRKQCRNYKPQATICKKGGGGFCGKYREFNNMKLSSRQKKILEVLI